MPASYPTSAKAFTVKNTGDIIQAADVDDLQDEVTAIEQTLITGPITLPAITAASVVVSGASSLASLHVTGGSTFAGSFTSSNSTVNNLSVSGNSTIAGELFVTKPPPYVRAGHSAKTDIPNNAVTAISFDTNRNISTSVMHSTSVTPSRFFAPSSGFYMMTGHIFWNTLSTAGAGAISAMDIRLNGGTDLAWQGRSAAPTGTDGRMSVGTGYRLSTTDYVELCVYQNTGSTASIQSVGNTSPEFAMVKIR